MTTSLHSSGSPVQKIIGTGFDAARKFPFPHSAPVCEQHEVNNFFLTGQSVDIKTGDHNSSSCIVQHRSWDTRQ